ncbi:peptidoglycan-binding domain-containing protein [Aristaeella hokkaidonensis]|uniref:Peptidoglycan-binding protein n=1 Tax=Aristaeella hokkaidonensis TaxID=3046382 RepID=A0AC61MVU3_9FIRM|nr:peptidoglycan-binding domain-containing protein [Aristaeella hokkaidonensis]QUC66744.1 peptidoglycan-binding protein [Aristaeella hokkaidonensis]SNT94721.1 Putative peptidoglycan binding domain-containing protein [Aristaeella hokkaidonensis]
MDLMKTLLIYMSATMALAVNSTAAPKETPVPTPAATAIVETVDTQAENPEKVPAVAVTNAAKPTAQITPAPVPTITPNVKAYHNLTMGTKGKEVKKLQEKLIEKGYLPEGSADGAYGRQTYNAVKKFQYYNGLKADGIAGRATQTNLFENPEMVDNPEKTEETETPAPEANSVVMLATPAPAETAAPEATDAPEPEATADEVPATDVPATDAPVTETPAGEAEATAEPEPTAEPEKTEEPKEETKQTAEDVPEDIEDIDLDAEEYEIINALVALNEADGPLEFIATEDGVPVTAKPRVSQCKDKIRISLDDLCKCVEGWKLTDDGVGTVVLEAAGYTLALYDENQGCTATVNGTQITIAEDDYDFVSEGHFINAQFLATALKGEAAWDKEENTLMLRIRDKDAVQYAD